MVKQADVCALRQETCEAKFESMGNCLTTMDARTERLEKKTDKIYWLLITTLIGLVIDLLSKATFPSEAATKALSMLRTFS